MSTATVVSGAPRVNVSLSASEAHGLTNLLNQFYIPKTAKTNLAGVREKLRAILPQVVGSSVYTGIPTITANRGTKAYRLG